MNIFNSDKLGKYMVGAAAFFLCLGLFAYPFSVAASSLFLGLLVLLTCVYFKVIKHGFVTLWQDYKAISIGILSISLLTFLGALWSTDSASSVHQIIKQFNWLGLPAIIGLVFYLPTLRKKAFIAVSLGLFLHLIVCTLQSYGVLTIHAQGSSRYDATGFIGHLSFGFIYAIWAGALIVVAQKLSIFWRLVCYSLALYSMITIFLAQGRSGYIIVVLVLLLVVWKVLFPYQQKLKFAAFLLLLVGTSAIFIMHEPSQNELKKTWSGVASYIDDDWAHVDARFKVWATGIELWKENPWFGIGTGDYWLEAKALLSRPEFGYLRQGQGDYSHPHNEFLFALVRWGPLGLLATLFLCWAWLSTGWKKDWEHDTMNAYLCTSSALAVIVHGMTEVSLNSKLSLVFAIIVLAFSLSKARRSEVTLMLDTFDEQWAKTLVSAKEVGGHLTASEMKFLFLLGRTKICQGVVLEIGSFKGKSTVILAEAAKLVGDDLIYAVDPLTQPSITCPQTPTHNTREEFYANMKEHQVNVIFHEMYSHELAAEWDKPIRLLWIDGDHTYKGAQSDVLNFVKYLEPGAIIAIHDVLNGHIGPLQVFAHEIVLNDNFGACGVVGSIGWAQYIGDHENHHHPQKKKLYAQLVRILPHLANIEGSKLNKFGFKVKRLYVPHKGLAPDIFLSRLDHF